MDKHLKDKITPWLRRQLFSVAATNGNLVKLSIRHAKAGRKLGSEIGTVVIPKKTGSDDLDGILNEIETIASDDASGLGGLQTYIILPHFADAPDRPLGRLVFKLRVDDDEDDDDLDSEGPNKAGFASQAMRHVEVLMKTHTMGSQGIISAQGRIITRQQEQIETMASRHIQMIELVEELTQAKHERDLEAKRADFMITNKQEIVSRLLMFIPNIVNRIAGKKVLKETTTASEQMLRGLMESIKPEQMQKLMESGVFTGDQMMTLLSIVEHIRKNFEPSKDGLNGESNGKALTAGVTSALMQVASGSKIEGESK